MNIEAPQTNISTEGTGRMVVRFAGDSGDGVQILGSEFAKSSALNGHDLITFPDFPAEIRAPVGTTFGVSAYQIQFGGPLVLTHGDEVDVLIAFNPAALKTNLHSLRLGGLLIIDEGAYTPRNYKKAGYEGDPLEDEELAKYQLLKIDITARTHEAVDAMGASKKQGDRAKNFWALGLVYWMFGRDRQETIDWIKTKFAKIEEVAAANTGALNAGHAYGETMEIGADLAAKPQQAALPNGTYRAITGIDAMSLGLAAAATCSGMKLAYCSYPITPATGLLHGLAKFQAKGVITFQAEDEIAAVAAAIGASFGGALGITGSSGPGIALKAEAMGLAVGAELPLIVVNVQRAGPSTGLPTKAEQADLLMAMYGRHGEAPCAILAPATPAECFQVMLDAADIALTYMTPVIVLADGYIANAAEPWQIPDVDSLPDLKPKFHTDPEGFHPFLRDEKTLARAWAIPGTPGMQHRIGGIERGANNGHISYEPENHQQMTNFRAEKIAGIANDRPAITPDLGPSSGKLAIVGWGSTYGAIHGAVNELNKDGKDVAHIHVRQMSPLPRGFEELLRSYDHILVPEMNMGQLVKLIRAEYLIDAKGLNQVTGKPFKVGKIKQTALDMLEN
ncbi:MAG: 2-oxoacid:acceptor oxidoreductase subunit alpha [Alphaproteobacteria bacterium]|nr:2-oxoacid:acceptor oxidoreductase subunit alpha [Alphaproteobacteria bacterium]MBT4082228.1 2-oxoacid:acceptor oxidoreductase subunit alpha [Alphaproteobacteria bacterium]MBT4544981.1 2-oxoacid:acceptor oxidoreductase subunit alpha [Alphaproteobacteria bacterium]MBT7745764.1 2-oxoacid:acceptor oxidoreductase subunit alpha [Alphaproteobacteria bacterium]